MIMIWITYLFIFLSTFASACGDSPGDDGTDGGADNDSGSDSDTDSDVDSDTDSDTDSDSDSDTDSDSDAECGGLDQACCGEDPLCQGDLECAGVDEDDVFCYETCIVELCDYDDEQGYCYDVGQTPGVTGVCQGVNMAAADCDHGDTGCVTEYGVSENTVCFSFASGTYCMEVCVPAEVICDGAHRCVPLVGEGSLGVCYPFG
jgi:hypothetical protein